MIVAVAAELSAEVVKAVVVVVVVVVPAGKVA